jgi:hypothetical protein
MTDGALIQPARGAPSEPAATKSGGTFGRLPIAAMFDPLLQDGELRTLAMICAYMRSDNYAWPSQGLLAFASGRSRSTINRHVKNLEVRGHLTVNRYRHADGSLRCTYKVNFTQKRLPQWPGKSRGCDSN